MTAHPIERVRIADLGAFAGLDVTIAPRLTVVVGDNAAGKSHLLGAAYAATAALHHRDPGAPPPNAAALGAVLGAHLVAALRPDRLGGLVNRRGAPRATLEVTWAGLDLPLGCSIPPGARSRVAITSAPPRWLGAAALLTPPPGPLPCPDQILGQAAGGGYLLWDTPEAGLGPRAITGAVASIIELARAGTQVIIATHSLFLLREVDLALADPAAADLAAGAGFVNLHRGARGATGRAAASLDEVGAIAALDAEVDQTERYLASSR